MTAPAGRVLYVTSHFPSVTETFVVNEWLALSGRFPMGLAALRRARTPLVHPESERVAGGVRHLPVLRVQTLAAHAGYLRRRPRAYLAALAAVVRGSARAPLRQAGKSALAFVKGVRLARIAERERVGHVHAHFANHPATAAWVVHRLTGVPFSFTAHANDLFVRPALLTRKAADARFVIAVSEFNRELLARCCPGARVEVVHCGVDPARFAPAGDGPARERRVLCVASLLPKKGHAHLLEAVAELAERHPDLVLDLIGSGPEREAIRARARALGIASRVRLRGARPAAEVRAALRSARLFVMPAVRDPSGRMEGIPVALMEAMAGGVPVVATRLSGIPELVQDGLTGLLVAPGDGRALAAAMDRLLVDEALAGALAARARQEVAESFNLATEAARLGDLFTESLAR